MAVPFLSSLSGISKAPGRTVATCGYPAYLMSAIREPPKAGLVAMRSRPSAPRPVQSAVIPEPVDAATRGASSLPKGVAENRTIAGSILAMTAEMHSAYASGM